MTTIPNPYLHDAAAHVWADRIKDMSREDLLDLASGLLSILEGSLGQHWNEADFLVKEYRPHLDQVTHGLGLSPDVHTVLATAQQASLDLHKDFHSEAGTMKVIGLLQGLAESLKLNASKGGKTKAKNSGTEAAKEAIREIWATGKYSTKQRCAEEECDALGIAYDTAYKALRGIPRP